MFCMLIAHVAVAVYHAAAVSCFSRSLWLYVLRVQSALYDAYIFESEKKLTS